MDGMHDLGGMHGFGPVPIETDGYVFKFEWQRRAFALVQALASPASYGADQHRQEIERIAPLDYLRLDYFEKWIIATEKLLGDAGLVNRLELETGKKLFDVDLSRHRPVGPEELVGAMKAGAHLMFPPDTEPPRFAVGQIVRVRMDSVPDHTRAPRYVRGKMGRIVSDAGVFQFADSVAAGLGPSPQHCYGVTFAAPTLWGNEAGSDDEVHVDLWEAYIEPA